VIFARGTGESGNVGAGAGPPWFNAMSSLLGDSKFAVQGVEYAASTAGIAGDSAGNAKVGELIALAVSKCPGTQVVLGGYRCVSPLLPFTSRCVSKNVQASKFIVYKLLTSCDCSQGAMIIHRGTASLPASSYAAIAAVVLFGDPFNGQPFASSISADKVKTFCHQGDDVCKGQYSITSDHLNYSNDAPEAARFVQGKVSL
jgi:cutinase